MYPEALKIHRLFHRMAQENRAVGNRMPGGLSIVQTQLLVELDADNERSLGDLERLLKLDQSSISRLAAGLGDRGLIKRVPDASDRRRYRLTITADGKRLISATDKFADRRLEEFCSTLSAQETRDLKRYFQLLGDGLGEPPAIPRPKEHPLRSDQRRLARAIGLLSDSYMKSDLPLSSWHLLAEVCYSRDDLPVKALSERLGLAKNSVSSMVASLEKKGLVKKVANQLDARSICVHPTSAGRELFLRLEESAARLIESALDQFSKSDAEKFAALLQRFVFAPHHASAKLLTAGRFRLARSEAERAEARSFLIVNGVRESDALHVPETLFGEGQTNVVFSLSGALHAAFQFERKADLIRLTCAGWLKAEEGYFPELLLRAAQFVGASSLVIDYAPAAAFADDVHLPKSLRIEL